MRFLQLLILLPFLAFSHGDDLYLLKGAKVFLGNDGFVVKDILVDDGKIILVEDFIENIETGKVLEFQDHELIDKLNKIANDSGYQLVDQNLVLHVKKVEK